MNPFTQTLFTITLFAVCGCASTPQHRWIQQRESISLAQDGLRFLHERGQVTNTTFLLADPWLRAARSENWKAYFALENTPSHATTQLSNAASLLNKGRQLTAQGQSPSAPISEMSP